MKINNHDVSRGLVQIILRFFLLTAYLLIGYPGTSLAAGSILIPLNSEWSYLDNGTNQGTAWRSAGFDDSTWSSGPAELGYGDGDEATTVSFGSDAANKYITTYFRHSFNVADANAFSGLGLRLLRDDGAVVYLNGTEVFRSNMPAGAINYTTLAVSTVGGFDEDAFITACVDPSQLVDGNNVMAVEIHQANPTSSDISFNLELMGSSLVRGPYLQTGTPNSVVVRWRTCDATNSRVRIGADSANLNTLIDDATVTTEHEVSVTGLDPNTRYYYSVGLTTTTLAGGDANHYFDTAPTPGTAVPTRIWVIGDSGTANVNARAVRDAYLSFTGATSTDVWLMLGDNAYLTGTDAQYQAAVFDMYPMLLRNTVVWPTMGNHDAEPIGVSLSTGTGPYFDMFTLPDQAQAGGLASGTEAYYSFDYGNVHFVCLNSTGSDRSPGSAMLTWLANDLAATTQNWTIAYWHHPPYTKGSHDSDNPVDSVGRMFDMRENVLPILEAHGVDLILSGHSHSYERSLLIDGHYGTSDTLLPSMILDAGDGRTFSDGVYAKPTLGPGSYEGAVYSVVGSSGLTGSGSLDHPAMFISLNTLGSMVIDVNDQQLDAKFIASNGSILDSFSLLKGPRVDAAPDIKANGSDGPLIVSEGQNLTVDISLSPGGYNGDPSDWWIWVLFFDTASNNWIPIVNTTIPAPIFQFPTLQLLNTNTLPVGTFLFLYGVDTNPNGLWDAGQVYFDFVVVGVQ